MPGDFAMQSSQSATAFPQTSQRCQRPGRPEDRERNGEGDRCPAPAQPAEPPPGEGDGRHHRGQVGAVLKDGLEADERGLDHQVAEEPEDRVRRQALAPGQEQSGRQDPQDQRQREQGRGRVEQRVREGEAVVEVEPRRGGPEEQADVETHHAELGEQALRRSGAPLSRIRLHDIRHGVARAHVQEAEGGRRGHGGRKPAEVPPQPLGVSPPEEEPLVEEDAHRKGRRDFLRPERQQAGRGAPGQEGRPAPGARAEACVRIADERQEEEQGREARHALDDVGDRLRVQRVDHPQRGGRRGDHRRMVARPAARPQASG